MLSAISRTRLFAQPSVVRSVRWASQIPPKNPASSPPAGDDSGSETRDTASSASEAEPLASGSSSKLPSLDFMPGAGEEEPKRTGARSSKGSVPSTEKKRKLMSRMMLSLLGGGAVAYSVYLGRDWEEEELKAKRLRLEDAPDTRWGKTKERFSDLFDYFNKPASLELLPPPAPAPHGKPYTLVLSLDDLLITSQWDRQHGWRTAKRPGLDYFLPYISQFYEVVIFTTQPQYTAIPIIDKLDRYHFFVAHSIFREGTRMLNGEIVKDLSYLNRDMSKVIVVDTVAEHVKLQPENAVVLPKWKGDPNDKGLIAIIPFLESVAIYKPADVRPILKAYEGKDIPIEYAKREAEAKARFIEDWKAKGALKSSVSASGISSLFGLSPASTVPQPPKGGPPLTYLEQKRREAQYHYAEEKKYLQENHDYLEKLWEQDQQAMAAQVPSNLWEVVDALTGKQKEPPQVEGSTPAEPSTPPAAPSS